MSTPKARITVKPERKGPSSVGFVDLSGPDAPAGSVAEEVPKLEPPVENERSGKRARPEKAPAGAGDGGGGGGGGGGGPVAVPAEPAFEPEIEMQQLERLVANFRGGNAQEEKQIQDLVRRLVPLYNRLAPLRRLMWSAQQAGVHAVQLEQPVVDPCNESKAKIVQLEEEAVTLRATIASRDADVRAVRATLAAMQPVPDPCTDVKRDLAIATEALRVERIRKDALQVEHNELIGQLAPIRAEVERMRVERAADEGVINTLRSQNDVLRAHASGENLALVDAQRVAEESKGAVEARDREWRERFNRELQAAQAANLRAVAEAKAAEAAAMSAKERAQRKGEDEEKKCEEEKARLRARIEELETALALAQANREGALALVRSLEAQIAVLQAGGDRRGGGAAREAELKEALDMIDRLRADLEAKEQENARLSGLTDTAKFNRERVRLDTLIGGLKAENARLKAAAREVQEEGAAVGRGRDVRAEEVRVERDRLRAQLNEILSEGRASDTIRSQQLQAEIGLRRREQAAIDAEDDANEDRVRLGYERKIAELQIALKDENRNRSEDRDAKAARITILQGQLTQALTQRREAEQALLARRNVIIEGLRAQLRTAKEEVKEAEAQVREVANLVAADVGGGAETARELLSAIRERRLNDAFIVRRRTDVTSEQEYIRRFTTYLSQTARDLDVALVPERDTGRFSIVSVEAILAGGSERLSLLRALLRGIEERGAARGVVEPLITIRTSPQTALTTFNRDFVCLRGNVAVRTDTVRLLIEMLNVIRERFRRPTPASARPLRSRMRPEPAEESLYDSQDEALGAALDRNVDVRTANLDAITAAFGPRIQRFDPLLAPSIPLIYDAVAAVFGKMSGLDSKLVELQTRADALALRLWGREGIEGGGRGGERVGRRDEGLVEPELRSLYSLTREDLPSLLMGPIQDHISEIVSAFVGSVAVSSRAASRPGPIQEVLEAVLARPEARAPLLAKLHETTRAACAATAQALIQDVLPRTENEIQRLRATASSIVVNPNTAPVPLEYARKAIFDVNSVADALLTWRRSFQETARQSVLTELGLFVTGPLNASEVRGPDDWQSRDTPASARNAIRDTLRYPKAAVEGLRSEVSRLLQSLGFEPRESQILNPLRVLSATDLATFQTDVTTKLRQDTVRSVFSLFDTLTMRLLESPTALTLAEAAVRERSRPALPFVTAEPADQDPRLRLIQPALRKAMFYMYANKVFVDGRLQNPQQQENGDGSGGVRDAGFTDSNLIINVLLKFAKLVAGAAGLPLRAVFNIERLRSEVSGGNFPQIDFADVLGTGIEGGGPRQPPAQAAAQAAQASVQELKVPEQKTAPIDLNDVDLERILAGVDVAQRQAIISAMNLRRSTLGAHWTARLRRCNDYAEFEDLFHYIVSPAVNVAIVSIYQLLKRSTQTRETFERIPLFELMRSPSFNVAFARLVAFQFARQNDANVARYPRQELQIVGALNDEATLQRSLLRYRPTERAVEWVRQMQGLRVISREGFDWLRFV